MLGFPARSLRPCLLQCPSVHSPVEVAFTKILKFVHTQRFLCAFSSSFLLTMKETASFLCALGSQREGESSREPWPQGERIVFPFTMFGVE